MSTSSTSGRNGSGVGLDEVLELRKGIVGRRTFDFRERVGEAVDESFRGRWSRRGHVSVGSRAMPSCCRQKEDLACSTNELGRARKGKREAKREQAKLCVYV